MVEAVPGNAGRADYPRMLYHPDGRTLVVQTPEQHQAHLEQGFSQNPSPQHQHHPVIKQPVVTDSITVLIREAVERVFDERAAVVIKRALEQALDERELTKDVCLRFAAALLQVTPGLPDNVNLPPVPLTSRSYTHGAK